MSRPVGSRSWAIVKNRPPLPGVDKGQILTRSEGRLIWGYVT